MKPPRIISWSPGDLEIFAEHAVIGRTVKMPTQNSKRRHQLPRVGSKLCRADSKRIYDLSVICTEGNAHPHG
ncbi:hypothetical protein Dimus_039745 [Dionaea muscipula]